MSIKDSESPRSVPGLYARLRSRNGEINREYTIDQVKEELRQYFHPGVSIRPNALTYEVLAYMKRPGSQLPNDTDLMHLVLTQKELKDLNITPSTDWDEWMKRKATLSAAKGMFRIAFQELCEAGVTTVGDLRTRAFEDLLEAARNRRAQSADIPLGRYTIAGLKVVFSQPETFDTLHQ